MPAVSEASALRPRKKKKKKKRKKEKKKKPGSKRSPPSPLHSLSLFSETRPVPRSQPLAFAFSLWRPSLPRSASRPPLLLLLLRNSTASEMEPSRSGSSSALQLRKGLRSAPSLDRPGGITFLLTCVLLRHQPTLWDWRVEGVQLSTWLS